MLKMTAFLGDQKSSVKKPWFLAEKMSNGFCFIIFFTWLAKSIINVAPNSSLNFVVAEITHVTVS